LVGAVRAVDHDAEYYRCGERDSGQYLEAHATAINHATRLGIWVLAWVVCHNVLRDWRPWNAHSQGMFRETARKIEMSVRAAFPRI
jgi:hypothetical protein